MLKASVCRLSRKAKDQPRIDADERRSEMNTNNSQRLGCSFLIRVYLRTSAVDFPL